MGGPVEKSRWDCIVIKDRTGIAVLTRSGQNRLELGVQFNPVSIASGSHPTAPNRPEITLPTQPQTDPGFGSIQEFRSNPQPIPAIPARFTRDSSTVPHSPADGNNKRKGTRRDPQTSTQQSPTLSFHSCTNRPQPNHGTIQKSDRNPQSPRNLPAIARRNRWGI